MPKDDIYLPLHVGAKDKQDIGFTRDDTGDNISHKNPGYCELTGLYWAWKNLDAEYVGLAHYRRHFGKKNKIMDRQTAEKLLSKADVILPSKRKYYIENLYSHYVNTMHAEPLDITFDIISEKYPEYLPQMEMLRKRTSAHMFNMFVMKKEHFDGYCEFLFGVLAELEERTKDLKFDDFHARFYGRISELLLDVWLNTNGIEYTEHPFTYMEKVNMFKKVTSFLMAKFFGKKYGKSF
ncbi:MAG: DUF4422 domain-containing protein [Clostridia bacterium]|nr:DUF4422 domain-containing protein [Clostridia bacterium]